MNLNKSSKNILDDKRDSVSFRPKNLFERILSKKDDYDTNLEDIVDPDQDYKNFQTHGLQLLNPETLYNKGFFETSTQYFKHTQEITLQCIKDQSKILDIVSKDAYKQLYKKDFKFIHLGLIMIGVRGLMRKNLGSKVLVTIFDNRISNISKGMIASTEIDLNNNKGIIYCSPDFLLTIKDFVNHIKIGIQTKGYEEVEQGDNLLITLGILGRCSFSAKTKYKVYTDKVVDLISSRGIKMVKPKDFSTEDLVGLDWNLSEFEEKTEKVLTPKEALMYTDTYGKTSLRFTDYTSVPVQETETDNDLVHLELVNNETGKIIFPKELKMFLSDEDLLKLEDQLYLSKQISDHEYIFYDKDKNIRVGILHEELESHITDISYQKDLVDEEAESYRTTARTPFDRTVPQETFSYASFPPRAPYTEYHDPPVDTRYIAKGLEKPLEQPIHFQSESKGYILNLTAHDPQIWTNVIEVWKSTLIGHYYRQNQDMDAEEMYRYLETFLGESTKAMWEAFKRDCSTEYNNLKSLGSNPYNFVNQIQILATGADPNSGQMNVQKKAMRELEQLSLYHWTSGKKVKQFLNHYVYLTSIAGNTFNQEIGNKLFHKLPGPLGLEIHDKWNNLPSVKENPDCLWSIGQRAQFITRTLEEKCVDLQIQKQLKQTDYKFCRDMYTTQTYGASCSKPKKKYKQFKGFSKRRYFLRKSDKRKPYLNEEKHVRKFKPQRNYRNRLSCYVCSSNEHLAKTCPKRINNFDRKSALIECVNEDLISVDEYISDSESIYSIITIEDTGLEHGKDSDSDSELVNEFTKTLNKHDTDSDSFHNLDFVNIDYNRKEYTRTDNCLRFLLLTYSLFLQMSKPPQRPGFPQGNNPAARPITNQTSSSQTRHYYDDRLRFGNNELIVFPPCSNVSFRTQSHISLSKEERCLIDNLWVAYRKDPKDVNYFIACLNALSDHFSQTTKRFKFYVVFKGKKTGFFHTWIEVLDATQGYPSPIYKGFNNYQEAISVARLRLGKNFFVSPTLRNYTEPPLDYSVTQNTSQTNIQSCNHCETLTKNFQIICDDNTQLKNENLVLQKQVSILSCSLNQNQGSSSGHIQKIKMGGHSPMNVDRGTIEPKNSMASPAQPVAGKDLSNPEMAMGLPKSQETQRTLDSSTDSQTQDLHNIEIYGYPSKSRYTPSSFTQDPSPSYSKTDLSFHTQSQEAQHLDSIQTCQHLLDQIEQAQDQAQTSPKKKKSKKKKTKDPKKVKNQINQILQEVIRDFVPHYIEENNSDDTEFEDGSSSPNQDQDDYYSEGG